MLSLRLSVHRLFRYSEIVSGKLSKQKQLSSSSPPKSMRSKISVREEGQKRYQSKNPCRQSGLIESSRRKEVSFKLTVKSGNRSACAQSKWKRVPDSRSRERKGSFTKVIFHVKNEI